MSSDVLRADMIAIEVEFRLVGQILYRLSERTALRMSFRFHCDSISRCN